MCIDHFSKYLWAVLIENKEAETIVKDLELIFNHFQQPKLFHSDNGTEFKNNSVIKYCEEKGIECRRGRPYHPQSQEAVERLNYFLGESLSIAFQDYTEKSNKRFEIGKVLKAYVSNHNNNVHTVTGHKPNKLVVTEDEKTIQEVNKKIWNYYNKRNVKNNQNALQVGAKVYITGNITNVSADNKLLPSKTGTKKNTIQKKNCKSARIKIPAEIVSIEDIGKNEVELKVCGGKLLDNMKLGEDYTIETQYLAVAKVAEWKRLVSKK